MLALTGQGAKPSHHDILAEYARLGIRPISGGGGEGEPATDDKATGEPKDTPDPKDDPKGAKPDDDLGDAGKAALQRERDNAKAAEKRAKDAEDRLAAIDAEAAKKKDEDAAAAGEWEKLAGERQTKLSEAQATVKTLTDERDALAAQVQSYEDRDRARIKAGVKDLPDDLTAFDPGDDVPLSQRLKWFETAHDIASKRAADPQRGAGRPPDPLRGDPKRDEEARKEQAKLARTF